MFVRSPKPVALLLAIVGIFALTASYAADSRLDDAVAHLIKNSCADHGGTALKWFRGLFAACRTR